MSANPPALTEESDNSQRDRLLRRLIGCFAVAALVTLGLAIRTSVWQQAGGDLEPVSLAQENPR